MLLNLFQRAVAEGDDLIQIKPRILGEVVPGAPGMTVHILPQTAIIPVAASCRQHGFIRAECLQIVNTTTGALQSLSVFGTAYVGVQGGHGVLEERGGCLVSRFLRNLVARTLVQGA